MNESSNFVNIPNSYLAIQQATEQCGFTMPSEVSICSLLRTLAATKPNGKFLELGTGTGLSTAWILDGMKDDSSLISIDNDASLLTIAEKYLGHDLRLSLIETDGDEWVNGHLNEKFDFIFADTWHGKYLLLDEVLKMLNTGGIYIIDDMLPQNNWPEGHAEKVQNLRKTLEQRTDITLTQLNWSSGVFIVVKI